MNGGARASLWVSWAPFSRRTETLARLFDLELRFVTTPCAQTAAHGPAQVPLAGGGDRAPPLRGDRHRELWVMDPPSPLVAMAGCVRAPPPHPPDFVDMHTVAFYAREWELMRRLELPALRGPPRRWSSPTSRSRAGVRAWGARGGWVLPDPLPAPPSGLGEPGAGGEVTVVATYSKDEPLDLLPEVARGLPDVALRGHGRPARRPERLACEPAPDRLSERRGLLAAAPGIGRSRRAHDTS